MSWTEDQLPALSGTTVLVTGANSGIGLHTADQLAAHGAKVILACRDLERGKAAMKHIQGKRTGADVQVVELDLASMASVRGLGENWTEPLDVLINNAGVMAPPKRASTVDGFELQFGTNHLGHYVLTGLLLPTLLASPKARVVTVASIAHYGGTADVVRANQDEPYRAQVAYSNSKLANLLFAFELQRRALQAGTALVSAAAHPGISGTGLVGDPQGMGANPFYRFVGSAFVKAFTQSALAGARPSLFAATGGEPGSYTGPLHFRESRGAIGAAKFGPLAGDEDLAHQLWTVSEDLTGFRYPWPARP